MVDKARKRLYKKWWFWTVVAVVIIFIGTIRENRNNEPNDLEETTKTSINSLNNGKHEEIKAFKIGDIVQLKDYKITVNKVRISNGGNYDKPELGNQFLYIDCTIENTSGKNETVSSVMMFKVEDKEGEVYDQAIAAASNGQLDGDLLAGKKLSGEYVVEVPKGKKGLIFVFESSLYGGEKATIDLN